MQTAKKRSLVARFQKCIKLFAISTVMHISSMQKKSQGGRGERGEESSDAQWRRLIPPSCTCNALQAQPQ